MTGEKRRTPGWVLVLSSLAVGAAAQPAAGQWDFGPAFSMADTNTNAVGIGGTLNLYPPVVWLDVHVYADAEYGWQNFKAGLGYLQTGRNLIVDGTGPRDPRGALWDWPGWNVHVSGYVTHRVGLLSAGPGYAYNGHDGTSDLAAVLIAHLTAIAELDVEFLGGGSWRMRVSVALWGP